MSELRQTEILRVAEEEGRVTAKRLAARFQVSVQTIRSDLNALSDAGRLRRVHGGAVLPSRVANTAYTERQARHSGAKAAIAAACARAIPGDCSIFLNIGTTTEAVARALLDHSKLLAVTNNMNIAQILAANADCEIVVAGGVLRRSDGGLVSSLTMRTIEQFKFDYAVIGCSALDTQGDILDFDISEVSVSQTILARARHSFLVADRSKFDRSAPSRIGSLGQIDTFFTDAPPPSPLVSRCAAWNTRIEVCP